MKRLVGVVSISLFAAACGVGDPDDGSGGTNMNPLGRQCTAVFSTSGSFAPDAAHPRRPGQRAAGRSASGRSRSTESNDCSPAPTLQQQYQFKGDSHD